MADDILAQPGGAVPPLDTVVLWITTTVERDFAERGIFPKLRAAASKSHRASSSLHHLSLEEADAVLDDAVQREQQVRKGLKTAYMSHVATLQAAIAEAVQRPSVFAADEPVCVDQWCMGERWRGSKQQLLAHGIQRDGPWPGEPGGKEHHCGAKDGRGYRSSIKRYSAIWPGLFEVTISFPREAWARESSQAADDERAERARRNLAAMPKSVDDFRADVIEGLRVFVRHYFGHRCKPSEFHGFRVADEVTEQVDEALDGVIEVLSEAKVHFDPVVQAAVEQRYRADCAAGDRGFQAKMAGLLTLNPAVLEGRSQ